MRLRWTPTAVRDLTKICDYIGEHDSPASARRVALTIYDGVNLLATFSYLGRIGRKSNTRELVFGGLPYLAVYRLQDEIAEIIRILHGSQKWP